MDSKMLKKYKIAMISLVAFLISGSALSQSFVPSQEQINQFKNMPRGQQEALARQLGIDIASFQNSGNSDNSGANTTQVTENVIREVDEQQISDELAKQSATQTLTAELKPFGYSLFDSVGLGEQGISFAPASNTPVPDSYVLGPGDSVNVQLFGKQNAQFELAINSEGTIQIPELGPMSAVGLTYQQLKAQLLEKYQEQVIGVTPYITMGQLRTIQIYIVGEAHRPGAFTLSALSTITHALFASGGVNEIGSLRNIQLKRNGQTVTEFDLYDLLIFGDTSKDKRLQQGDVIFIPTVQKVVSVAGNVRRPAIYEAKQTESLQDIIAIAGGLLPSGAAETTQIARKTAGKGLEVKTVNLLNAKSSSVGVQQGDYIFIPDGSNEFKNAVSIVGAYATPGLVQWHNSLNLSSLIDERSLLNSTDLQYALVVRKAQFENQSQVFQFSPLDVIQGKYDLALQAYDKITMFNRFESENLDSEEKAISESRIDGGLLEERTEQSDYLQQLAAASFSDQQLILDETKQYSRKQLIAPIIAQLKDEASFNKPVKLAEITGQVKFPGVYPISENGRVKDLVIAAGGLIESSYVNRSELSRTSTDADNSYQVQHIQVNLQGALLGNQQDNLLLQSKDTLAIQQTPDWYENRQVTLKGEVVFPGTYQIKKNETLSQIIQRAGGFTKEASIGAAIFTREELKQREKDNLDKTVEELRQQIIASNISGSQNVKSIDYETAKAILNELVAVEPVGRLVVDLPTVLNGKPNEDVVLKHRDMLFVPSISNTVSIIGEVFVPSTHTLNLTSGIDAYIEKSGGLTGRADASKIYIVKANGSVKIPQNSFWFNDQRIALEPGDTIVVPRDVINYERLGLWQTVTQIVYNSAIALVAIGNL
jgi:protein involved in polysaccharide export with SLBB domain